MKIIRTVWLLMVLTGSQEIVGAESHGWPIEPGDQDHPLGNTLGEFQALDQPAMGKVYQHAGIDILTTAYPANPDAPWVIVTVGGTVAFVLDEPDTKFNDAEIVGHDGNRYRYYHLSYNSFSADFIASFNNGQPVAGGDRIARVTSWGCGYEHLHYDTTDGAHVYLNPLSDINPKPDSQSPDIFDIHFARHGARWNAFNAVRNTAEGNCLVVNGKVDVIAKVRDRDDAGSTLTGAMNVGVYNIRWRVCPSGALSCGTWQDTLDYSAMPIGWENSGNVETKQHFSTTTPWISSSDVCAPAPNETFIVMTGFSDSGAWNTKRAANGNYVVTLEASDIVGNTTTKTSLVCVDN